MKTYLETNMKPLAYLLSFLLLTSTFTVMISGCAESTDNPVPSTSNSGNKPDKPSSESAPTYLSDIAVDTAFSYNEGNIVEDSLRTSGGLLDGASYMKIRYIQTNRPIRPNTKQIIGYLEFDDIPSGYSFDLYKSSARASFNMQSGANVSHYFDLDSLTITDWLIGNLPSSGVTKYDFIVLNSQSIRKSSSFPVYITTKNFKGSAKGSINFKMLFEIEKAGSEFNSMWFNHVYGEEENVTLLEFKE